MQGKQSRVLVSQGGGWSDHSLPILRLGGTRLVLFAVELSHDDELVLVQELSHALDLRLGRRDIGGHGGQNLESHRAVGSSEVALGGRNDVALVGDRVLVEVGRGLLGAGRALLGLEECLPSLEAGPPPPGRPAPASCPPRCRSGRAAARCTCSCRATGSAARSTGARKPRASPCGRTARSRSLASW